MEYLCFCMAKFTPAIRAGAYCSSSSLCDSQLVGAVVQLTIMTGRWWPQLFAVSNSDHCRYSLAVQKGRYSWGCRKPVFIVNGVGGYTQLLRTSAGIHSSPNHQCECSIKSGTNMSFFCLSGLYKKKLSAAVGAAVLTLQSQYCDLPC